MIRLLLLLCAYVFTVSLRHGLAAEPDRPNIVLIFADDLGYGDLGCYGTNRFTPRIDRMAREGVRFTDFYVPQAVCSASRAALMTGCYPNRIGISGALPPKSKVVLNTNELTIAEVLKTRGYATSAFGKWHLGDVAPFLPTYQGFDEYYGLPYSNDMWPQHPVNPEKYPPLPLIEGDRVIETMPDQAKLTRSYTERAVKFVEKNKSKPFFLYVAHNMPHVPLFVSEKFKGKTGAGLYADVLAEIDWSVGEILDALKKHGIDDNTLVVFSSDNGPWLLYGNHAGSAGPLREGKATAFEGGVRVPLVARWPGKIAPASFCREFASTMDLLPTFAKLAGAELAGDRRLDGKDIWPLLTGKSSAKTPHEAFYYYWHRELQAIRSGKWKLHFPHFYTRPNPPGGDAKPGKFGTEEIGLSLFDLEKDPSEKTNLAHQHPDVVKRLEALAEKARDDLGDSLTQRTGRNLRPPGKLPERL